MKFVVLAAASAMAMSLAGCASFESRFTSQTGCPEEDIHVLKRSNNLLGNQSYTIACHGRTYYCTESFLQSHYSNLKCALAAADTKARKRRPSSTEGEGASEDAGDDASGPPPSEAPEAK
jgi:hypothetical protein